MHAGYWLFLPCALSLWAQNYGATDETIASLNAQILRAPQSSDAELSLRKRFPLLQALIRSNPDRALSLAFSDGTIASLRGSHPSLAAQLETRGRWEGEGVALVEDSRDVRSSRTYLRLHSSEANLNIYPSRSPGRLI
jgi:hypothetical protein